MDPNQPYADQNGHQSPLTNGLNVAPPVADGEQHPSPHIAGKERFEEAVGKAMGGTVIASDIRSNDLPTATKLDAELAEKNSVPPPSQQQATPASDEKTASPTIKHSETLDKDITADGTVHEDPKNRTPGAFPLVTRIGWLEAYKRTDGPSNEFRDKSIWMDEFASSALFGAFWHNAVALVVIPIVCFICFKLGGGFVTLILIIAFGCK
jgi:hypothetical protein